MLFLPENTKSFAAMEVNGSFVSDGSSIQEAKQNVRNAGFLVENLDFFFTSNRTGIIKDKTMKIYSKIS
jgi:hypothetical protein